MNEILTLLLHQLIIEKFKFRYKIQLCLIRIHFVTNSMAMGGMPLMDIDLFFFYMMKENVKSMF